MSKFFQRVVSLIKSLLTEFCRVGRKNIWFSVVMHGHRFTRSVRYNHHPICHKKSVAKTLLRRADCLPSSLDSKAEERKYASNVLKANSYTKTFLRNCQKPVTTSSTPDEREPATGFAVNVYIQSVAEPIKRILNSHNVKVVQKPFQTLGHIFAKPKDPVTKEQRTDAIYSIPCNDCDNELNTSDRPNVSLVHVWKSIKKRFSFVKRKIQLYRSTHT